MKSMIRSTIAIALFAVAPATVYGQVGGGPEAVVRALVLKDKTARLTTQLPAKPNGYMKKQFTSAFNASWANAMSRGRDEPVIDGDLITGRQTVTRVTLKSSAVAENGDFAMVSTNIVYVDEDGPRKSHSETVRFFLKKEQGIWKVDDINAGDLESIRTNFKKSYGQ